MSTVIHNKKDIVSINKIDIDELKILAKNDPDKRARICLHKDDEEPVQEMIIALYKDCYIIPHRHINKSESYHIIEGELKIIFFDDNGTKIDSVILSSRRHQYPHLCRISNISWHTVIPLEEYVILHEVTNGPFKKNETEYADWRMDRVSK